MTEFNRVVISISVLEQKIHQLVNQNRQRYALTQLVFDIKLSEIARKHSQDMGKRRFFAHQTPEGKSPTDRGITAGYICRKNYGNYYTKGIAENIYMSHLYKSVIYYNNVPTYNWMNTKEIANSTVVGWMSSPGHRKNILTATYECEGIGVAVSKEHNEIYITQNFC